MKSSIKTFTKDMFEEETSLLLVAAFLVSAMYGLIIFVAPEINNALEGGLALFAVIGIIGPMIGALFVVALGGSLLVWQMYSSPTMLIVAMVAIIADGLMCLFSGITNGFIVLILTLIINIIIVIIVNYKK